MSDALYHVRLRWGGRMGCAKFGNVQRRLETPPDVGFSYVEIDYRPPVASVVRPYPWNAPRDMLPAESAACARYLRAMDALQPDLDQPVDTATGLECGMPAHVGRKA